MTEEAKTDDDPKADEAKAAAKADDAKADDAKADDAKADDAEADDAKADPAATREAVLDLARGEVNDEDLDALEQALDTIDFATRKATPEVVQRLEALQARFAGLVDEIRRGERKPRPERETLSEEALQIAQNLVDQGVAAGEKGNLHEAREYLEEAVKLNPDGEEGLFNLGVVYGLLAHHNIARAEFYDDYVRDEVWIEKAKICYDHLLELVPDHPASLNNLATLYSLRDNLDEAIPLLRRLIAVEPKDDAERALIEGAKNQLQELESI